HRLHRIMSTSPDSVDDLFGTPAEAAVAPSAPAPAPASAPDTGSAESRRERRVKVSWPARVQLPNGRGVELRVRDLSPSGVGLRSEVQLPVNAVLMFAVGVPSLSDR